MSKTTMEFQVESVAYCPLFEDYGEPSTLAVASSSLEGAHWNGELSLLDGMTGEILCQTELPSSVSQVVWCGTDYNTVALACDDSYIRVVRIETDVDFRAEVQSVDVQKIGHEAPVSALSTHAKDLSQLLSAGFDSSVKLWSLSSMECPVRSFNGHLGIVWDVSWNSVALDSFASVSSDHSVQIWDMREETSVTSVQTEYAAMCLDWHPTREYLVSVGLENGDVNTYDIRASLAAPLLTLSEHDGCVYNLKYHPLHQDVFASASDDTTVKIMTNKASTDDGGHVIWSFDKHTDYVRGLSWGNERFSTLATGSWDKSIQLLVPEI